MSEMMQMPKHGEFCWMELTSKDVEPCKSFYSNLFGWKYETSEPMPGVEYNEIEVGGKRIGGMFQMTEECSTKPNGEKMPSHWMAYVAVDNVDDVASRVSDLGGMVCVPPTDIPNVGRFAVVLDPSKAAISIITLKQS